MGLAIASVYILEKKNTDQIDRVPSIAISVIQDIKIFFVLPACKTKISLRSPFSQVDTKRRQERCGYLRVGNKTRLVGIVSKKNRVKKEIRLCIS